MSSGKIMIGEMTLKAESNLNKRHSMKQIIQFTELRKALKQIKRLYKWSRRAVRLKQQCKK